MVSAIALAVVGSAAAQITLSADFDTGSLGELVRLDSVRLALGEDSLTVYSLHIASRIDPPNPIDTTITPGSRWFHFRMEGVRHKPLFLHMQETEVCRPFFSYDGEEYRRFGMSENLLPQTVSTTFERDTVYVAYFVPYTHRRHVQDMERWNRSPFARREVIGHSFGGLPIEMLTVTDTMVPDSVKRKIWIHARVHTSEAPASWHMAALVDTLLGEEPVMTEIRRHAVFYIVPETNPDGVAGGYSRSTPTGVNLEVNWNDPDSLTAPEVVALKRTIERLTSDRPMDVALNLHSQIAPHATYWIHTAESTSPGFFRRELLLSALTMSHTPLYGPGDQSFSALNPKYPEGWIWDMFGSETLALTFETPSTYFRNDPQGEWVSPENLAQLGHASLLALCDLLGLGGTERFIAYSEHMQYNDGWIECCDAEHDRTNVSRRKRRDNRNPQRDSHPTQHSERHDTRICFGDTYLVAEEYGAKVTFCFDNLPAGTYDILKWIPGIYGADETCGGWCTIGEVVHKINGQLQWEYTASVPGDIMDVVMLVRRR